MENNLTIAFSKSGEVWHAFLFDVELQDGEQQENNQLDEVVAGSYSEMNIEIANKGWIDLLNKNQK
tara:strand:- start:21682 stop:21879 length:198 start_codon:yes stop_codon:yes gene_type:complete